MFQWVEWSNPVALWWIFLTSVSVVNVLFWIWSRWYLKKSNLILLSGFYVFICAFRSILPRADVQRICLWDTWFSSVFVGRSVATVAELCFVAQWALVLNQVAILTQTNSVEKISRFIVPTIFIAECFSWYAVIRTHYMGNTFEESLWGVTYTMIALCLVLLVPKFKGPVKMALGFAVVGCLLYVVFMATVDVPMYFTRWQYEASIHKPLLGFFEGIHDLQTRWVVTHDIAEWKEEIPWMSLYFSVAVWTSLALCYVPLTKERLAKYLSSLQNIP